ncbi:hypothetical protein E1K98_08580 [Salmonella enterica subsp. enterica serovar Fluntern]|nr:hypothetical protein D8S89_15995 [Salmonella enterica subsp. enterica serovar Montevideo]EAA9681006.1 hypothetical protein [Salmonella enterica]EBR9457698.1 hypothetical protein [Salmonella enterica subsp. enterica serovar Fluntern]ECI4436051.1 hypothetical protein [Salmonella enterica subsp. enterica]QCJ23158.1 hypothetical protein FA033_05180 [Salmonella enterica subsp. enterica serovar Typhimurium]QDF11922.1 hypothetical protein E4L53_17610 [Salmonella enterica subsp. enterica serovar In
MAQEIYGSLIIYDLNALLLPRFLYFRYIPAVAARRHGLFSPHDEEFSVNKIPALLLLILLK